MIARRGVNPLFRWLIARRPSKKKRPQTGRMLKVECVACGYLARTTRIWLELKGPPLCPCNSEPMRDYRVDEVTPR